MKKVLALIVAVVMVLAMTAVFSCAEETYQLPTTWNGETADWTYMKYAIFGATYNSYHWVQICWSIDIDCPEWAWTECGLSAAPDVCTWYGTDGTDGALASLQAMESGETYQLQTSYNIWPACEDVRAIISGLTNEQKNAAADEIAYYNFLEDKCIELLGNVNGIHSEGITADSSCQGVLYLAEIIRDAGDKITAAAGNPGTSDVAPVIAIFAGVTVLAAAAVVLKKKFA